MGSIGLPILATCLQTRGHPSAKLPRSFRKLSAKYAGSSPPRNHPTLINQFIHRGFLGVVVTLVTSNVDPALINQLQFIHRGSLSVVGNQRRTPPDKLGLIIMGWFLVSGQETNMGGFTSSGKKERKKERAGFATQLDHPVILKPIRLIIGMSFTFDILPLARTSCTFSGIAEPAWHNELLLIYVSKILEERHAYREKEHTVFCMCM